ncbi:hypothetical protein Ddye_015023 [Dipteronia dyeriana]|uniref:FBD domain-containing protein n=1 Tax=Dipteronia dyeriana TaxID=168575 RepID=A0AAD9WXI1_9ROSI|nr:hypothetical protein Ddye_015023 [Dipteronia dyeriana]
MISPFLDVASLAVHEMPGAIDEMDELEVNRATELLRGINCTKSLSLTAYTMESVPSCLRLHLKVIEITDMRGMCGELEVIKYLLKNSEVLEKLEVNLASSMKKKYLRRQILSYYRGSPIYL